MAHTLFIQSSRYAVSDGKTVPLFFCYGHFIPVSDGLRGKKLKNIRITPPDGAIREIAVRNQTDLHSYPVSYDQPGTWMLTAETNPGYYTIYMDKKGREHHVIKPMSKVKDRAEKILTSLYAKQYTKTYVACGKPEKGQFKRAGLDLELMPVGDLFTLKPGDTLELDVYHHGELFDGEGSWDATYMGFSTQPEDMFYQRATVKGSRLSIPIAVPGRWFVRYFIKVDAPESEKDKYLQLKQAASLVLQVDGPRMRARHNH